MNPLPSTDTRRHRRQRGITLLECCVCLSILCILVGSALLVLGLLLLTPIQATSSYASLLPGLVLVGLGLAFVAVPQSALFVQEATARCFGAVTAFRTTCGQLGFAMGFAASGALVHGFGVASLRHRLLDLGVSASAIPALLCESRVFLSHGIPPGPTSLMPAC